MYLIESFFALPPFIVAVSVFAFLGISAFVICSREGKVKKGS